jgi:long-chain acyl-CoA synthetase
VIAHSRLGRAKLAEIRSRSPRALAHVCIGGRTPGFAALERFVAPYSAAPRPADVAGRVMAYTSATTGRPKGVRLPSVNAGAALAKTIDWHVSLGIEPEAGNVHLCASMLYHSAPLEGALIALHMGHCVVLVDGWRPSVLLELVARHRVTTSFLVPAMLVRLTKLPEAARRRFSSASLRFVVHGGAPCPVDVKHSMIEWWGPIIWEAYGASEAQGTIVSSEEWLRRPGTVGKPIPGSAIAILDDFGARVPPGNEGLVYIKPHTGDRFEYKGDPAATSASYHGELVTVGDIGRLDADGNLYLCDRRADLILSSGMNIYPAEIEQALVQHPAVADCLVVGMAHDLFGQVPKAVVQLERNVLPCARVTAELLGYLADRLSPMKLPRRIEYTSLVPRDPNGKLYRRRLQHPASRHSTCPAGTTVADRAG